MIARLVGLVTIWVALWGQISLANVVTGFVTATAVLLLFPSTTSMHHRAHLWGSVVFLARLFKDVVTSSWAVVVTVVRPTQQRLHTEVVSIDLETTSPLVATIVANAITLTPGTMTVAMEDDTFIVQVHVLGGVDAVHFEQQIRSLERRVQRAISITTHSRKKPQ